MVLFFQILAALYFSASVVLLRWFFKSEDFERRVSTFETDFYESQGEYPDRWVLPLACTVFGIFMFFLWLPATLYWMWQDN